MAHRQRSCTVIAQMRSALRARAVEIVDASPTIYLDLAGILDPQSSRSHKPGAPSPRSYLLIDEPVGSIAIACVCRFRTDRTGEWCHWTGRLASSCSGRGMSLFSSRSHILGC
jgi:hypothetical protein